jgi:hypothetical protein
MKFRDLWRLSLLGAALLAALASAGGSGCGPEKGKLGQPCAYASEGTSFFDGDYYCDDGLVCVVQELPTFTTTCRHCENVSLGGPRCSVLDYCDDGTCRSCVMTDPDSGPCAVGALGTLCPIDRNGGGGSGCMAPLVCIDGVCQLEADAQAD